MKILIHGFLTITEKHIICKNDFRNFMVSMMPNIGNSSPLAPLQPGEGQGVRTFGLTEDIRCKSIKNQ